MRLYDASSLFVLCACLILIKAELADFAACQALCTARPSSQSMADCVHSCRSHHRDRFGRFGKRSDPLLLADFDSSIVEEEEAEAEDSTSRSMALLLESVLRSQREPLMRRYDQTQRPGSHYNSDNRFSMLLDTLKQGLQKL